ncbi:MAG: exonuclease SbcCD subunit D, partial [Caldilineales bacterium]|nr:exonuclease SbcCD subunit D [Caldilineales bacterium]
PIRILHFADLHIGMERFGHVDPGTGMNSRVMDFLRRLSDLIEYAIAKEVDLVIFAGDAYKNRDPNSTYRREFAWRIKDLADHGIPVVLLPGNHDLPAVSARASSIDVFQTLSVPNTYVLSEFDLQTIVTRRGAPVQIASVPYPFLSEIVAKEEFRSVSLGSLDNLLATKMDEIIRALADEARQQPNLPAILVGHFSVSEAELGSERGIMVGRDVTVPRSTLADDAWDYVALGHIHRFQDLNKGAQPPIVYSGSVERIDFGEEKEAKGWVLAEVARGHSTYEFIPGYRREARRFVTIDCDLREEADPTQAVLDAIARRNVAETVVRVRLRLRSDQDALLKEREIRAALAEASALAGISKDIDWGVRSRLGAVNVEEMSPLELLERYFQVSEIPAEQSQQLLADAEEIVRQVDGGE